MNAVLAATLTVSMLCGGIPSAVHAEEGQENPDLLQEGAESNGNFNMSVEELLSAGPYEEGQVLVLYDRYANAEEGLTGAGSDPSDLPSGLSGSELIDTVSAESYVKASGETLEVPVGSDGNGGESASAATGDRISVLLVEREGKDTGEILTEVMNTPGVLFAQPNYIHSLDGADGADQGVLVGTEAALPSDESTAALSAAELAESGEAPTENVTAGPDESTDAAAEESRAEDESATETGNAGDEQSTAGNNGEPQDKVVSPEDKDQDKKADASASGDSSSDTTKTPGEKDKDKTESTDSLTERPETEDIIDPDGLSTIEDLGEENLVGNAGGNEAAVGAGTGTDFARYQWEYAGDTLIPVTEHDPGRIYNIHAPSWNQAGKTNSEGVVAVIDTGVDYTHPDLKNVMYQFPSELQKELNCGPYGANFADGNRKDPMDLNSHGTHCAGTIAGAWDGYGISGMCSGCKIMALKVMKKNGTMSDLGIYRAMAFVADAADKGVDVRVTNNSYGGIFTWPIFTVELLELEKRGIVCIYSSGNESEEIDKTQRDPNGYSRASNIVVVNAATALGSHADFSNYGERMTHVYAPGGAILSSVSTDESANEEKMYFGSLDPSAFYYNTTFSSRPAFKMDKEKYPFELASGTAAGSYSYDRDGRAVKIKITKAKQERSSIEFAVDIPIGANKNASYASLAFYAPGGQYSAKIYRNGVDKDKKEVKSESSDVTVEGSWTLLSCSDVPDKIAKGAVFNPITSKDGKQKYVRIFVRVFKVDDSFKVGDTFYVDQIGAGSGKGALLPFCYWDGTSMATPHVAAEAAILYTGRTRSMKNASEVVSDIKSKVTGGSNLSRCTSHGKVDLAVEADDQSPVVENAVVNKADRTITITGSHFLDKGKVFLAGTSAEVVSWSDQKIVIKCPKKMKSGVQSVKVDNENGTGSGSFLLYAPDTAADSATPLYEIDIPDIPSDLVPAGSWIQSVVGLNDALYVLMNTKIDEYGTELATVMLRYSIKDKTWKKETDLPYEMYFASMIGYRGKLIINATFDVDGGSRTDLYSYSPRTGKWKSLDWLLNSWCTLVNINDSVYALGGRKYDKEKEKTVTDTAIQYLDIAAEQTAREGELEKSVYGAFAATDGKAIYLSGGTVDEYGTVADSKDILQKIEFPGGGKAKVSLIKAHANPIPSLYPEHENIAGYQNVYLPGFYVETTDSSSDSVATNGMSVTKPQGVEDTDIIDEDTFVLKNDVYKPYGKRISHDILYQVRSAEYKGVLYSFGWSVFDGDQPINLVSRATAVGEANAPCWDTVTVKIPAAATGLVYNGKEQIGVPASAEGYYTIKGNKEINAGEYQAVLTLADKDWYCWEDGTTEDKVITWKIAKKKVTATPKPRITKRGAASTKVSSKSTGTVKSKKTSVRTGDTSMPILWIVTGAIAAIIIFVALKRKNKS